MNPIFSLLRLRDYDCLDDFFIGIQFYRSRLFLQMNLFVNIIKLIRNIRYVGRWQLIKKQLILFLFRQRLILSFHFLVFDSNSLQFLVQIVAFINELFFHRFFRNLIDVFQHNLLVFGYALLSGLSLIVNHIWMVAKQQFFKLVTTNILLQTSVNLAIMRLQFLDPLDQFFMVVKKICIVWQIVHLLHLFSDQIFNMFGNLLVWYSERYLRLRIIFQLHRNHFHILSLDFEVLYFLQFVERYAVLTFTGLVFIANDQSSRQYLEYLSKLIIERSTSELAIVIVENCYFLVLRQTSYHLFLAKIFINEVNHKCRKTTQSKKKIKSTQILQKLKQFFKLEKKSQIFLLFYRDFLYFLIIKQHSSI